MIRDLEFLPGFIIGGHTLKNRRYADDTVLMSGTERNR